MIEYDKYQKSLKHLEEQYKHYSEMDDSYPDWIKDGIGESVIQRFETCFDCMWKVLKRYIHEELGLAEVPNSPKPLFRIAAENQLFAADIQEWFNYLTAQNNTAHDYSGEKAKESLKVMENYIDNAIGLYQTMSGKTWK
jgi:nucleotidyltransferase substrate binding protein (TIGR01987 family)